MGVMRWVLSVVVVMATTTMTTITTTTIPLLWLSIKEASAVAVAQQDIGGSLSTTRATR
jgi:hypothetical protein